MPLSSNLASYNINVVTDWKKKKNRTPFPGKDSLQTPIKNTIEICTTLSDLNTRSDGQTDLIIHSFYLHCAKRP
jgi:hypothetical protein